MTYICLKPMGKCLHMHNSVIEYIKECGGKYQVPRGGGDGGVKDTG